MPADSLEGKERDARLLPKSVSRTLVQREWKLSSKSKKTRTMCRIDKAKTATEAGSLSERNSIEELARARLKRLLQEP